MIQNPQVARHYLVLENSPGWNVDTVAVVGDDDHGPLDKWNISIFKIGEICKKSPPSN